MFDKKRMSHILILHEKSYALLRWTKDSLRSERLTFSVVHDASDSAAAAHEWIGRHLANIPEDVRPEQADVGIFARLFVSFLTTSFQFNRNSIRLVSPCGCRCRFCSYLQAGPNLDPRTPSKKDFATGLQLKRIYVSRLAAELEPPPSHAAIETVLGTRELRESVALATWGAELLRRAEFASQGQGVLALWREFAWANGRPRGGFQITAQAILDAERRVCDRLSVPDQV